MTQSRSSSAAPDPRGRRPGPKSLAREQTRETICDVAALILKEEGLDAVSMREISRRLGVTPMMLYTYFPSLDALLVELRTRSFVDMTIAFRKAAASRTDARGRLFAMGHAYVAFAADHPERYRLAHDLSLPRAEIANIPTEGTSWELLLQTLQTRLGETGSAADPVTLGNLIWSALHGLASLHLAGRLIFQRDVEALIDPMISAFIDHPSEARRTA